MGKTLLKMQMSTTIMRWEGDNEGREKSKHAHVQGMWFKSLDLKTTSPKKLAMMEFPENSLCHPKRT